MIHKEDKKMIYIASLAAFGKKTYGDKIYQTKINKIVEQLMLNPKVSGMDSIIIGPKDLTNVAVRESLTEALKKKHDDILVIYLYTNDKEEKYLVSEHVLARKIDKRINLQSFKETTTSIFENWDSIKKSDVPKKAKNSEEEPEPIEEIMPTPLPKEEPVEEKVELTPPPIEEHIPEEEPASSEPAPPPIPTYSKMTEDRIRECIQFSDWDLFKRLMTKETIVSDLMLQNNDYASTINMLSNLDRDIVKLFKDEQKTVEERFDAIKTIGVERSNYRVKQNNIIAEKIASILTTITISAESMIHNRLQEITAALDYYEASDKRLYRQNKEILEALIEDRMKLQLELHELSKNLITVYQSMDVTVNDIIATFDNGLPSDNTYVNEVYKSTSEIFTPVNASKLASKLMSDLQKNRISLSALENLIQEVVSKVFYLCEIDESIISHQNKLIKLLESQNVEDVVIVDTILKNALRLYIGPHDVGTRATTITLAGVLSRRQNTLLLDLSGNAKFKDYGIEPVTLEHFLENRIEDQLVCVEGHILNPNNLDDIIKELKMRLNYYPYINIILDPSQISMIEKLAEHALSITYITDCTNRSNAQIKQCNNQLKQPNIAKKTVLIDPTVDELLILQQLSIDPLTTKIITLPYLSKMKSYAIKGQPPYNDPELRDIYELAFR